MAEPIQFPAPPLAPGQVAVKIGGKRYVLNVPPDNAGDDRATVPMPADDTRRS